MAGTLNNVQQDAIAGGTTERRAITRYVVAVASVAIAHAIQFLVITQIGQRFPFFLFVFAVVYSAAFGGRGPGLLATALSAIAVNFTFLGIPFSFAGIDRWELVRTCLFTVLGIFITLTVDRLKCAYENLQRSTLALEQANARLHASEVQLLKANEELQITQDSLSTANVRLKESNEDLQRFAYSVSHDLQTPIRTIGTFCQLLSRRYRGKLDPDADELLDHIDSGLGRMNTLVHDLLEYSRVTHDDSAAMAATDCNEVLCGVLKDCAASIRETNAIITAASLPTVHADPRRMSQVFMNLIENALKYRSAQPPSICICARPDDGHWLFSVTDNGIGFDMANADRIFTAFVRLHSAGSAYKGNGIGLAIVKQIVERRGGTIWAESKPEAGSTFYFTVPSAPPKTNLG